MPKKKPSYEKSFASHKKSKYWHPTKNDNITPRDIFKGTHDKYWFKCPDKDCNHDFEMNISNITCNNNWCPYCSNHKLCDDNDCSICYNKSFASYEKAKYWHETKNNNVKPRDIFKCSGKKYWFKCPDKDCNHNFKMSPNKITSNNRWCPYCSNHKLCDDNDCSICYNKSFASHKKSKYWHPTKNGNVKPRDIFKGTHDKYWFKCPNKDCNHDFEIGICHITSKDNSWCQYCCIPVKMMCKFNFPFKDCNFCYNNSFASHEKAKYWHPTKNGDITPRDIFKGTDKKYWFKCPTCKHDFEKVLNKITSNNRWCPYCSNQKLCEFNFPLKDCSICYNKSFASHKKAEYWHPTKNGDITPRDIFKGTDKKYWFKCPNKDCNHDFEMIIFCITRINNTWCPYCCNPSKKKCEFNFPFKDCNFCYNKTFASHKKAEYWHPTKNGDITPRDIFKGTHKKYWFKCNKGCDDFEMQIHNITSHNRWCPSCKLKTEHKFYKYLQDNKEILNIKTIERKYRPDWANLKDTHQTFYEYDFYIELNNDKKIIIEIDGRQHYTQVSNWGSPLLNQIRDYIKEKLAINKEINIIRLNQEDLLQDVNDWKIKLEKAINDINRSDNILIIDGADGERYIN